MAELLTLNGEGRYEEFPHTVFPQDTDDTDNHPLMSDIKGNLLSVALAYSNAISSNNTIYAEQLLHDNPDLKNSMFNAEKYNWMRDAICAMQQYYLNDVQDMITSIGAHTIGLDDDNSQNSPLTNGYSISKIEGMVNGTATNVTLYAEAGTGHPTWVGNSAPYTYTIDVTGVTANNNVDVSLTTTATLDQAKLWAKAMVMNATQTSGSITLKAYGKKPTADIPITIIVHK